MSQAVTHDPATEEKKSKSTQLNTPFDGIIRKLAKRVGGEKAREVERFIKFAIVGLIGFIIDFGTVFFLQSTFLPPVDANGESLTLNVAIATTIGFILAVLSNFTWNRIWTYPDSRTASMRKQLTQFAIVSVSGWTARTIWIASAYVFLGNVSTSIIQWIASDYSPSLNDERKFGTMIAQFFGVIVVMIWNFFANRYWTYNDVD